jgi:FkbM family methyltransferase
MMTTVADVVLARAAGKKFLCGTPEEDLLFGAFCIENMHLSYSQRLQDLWVLYEFGLMRNGFFIDFGAGNGRDSSNSYILHRRFGWRGILIEPNSDYEDNLRHHASEGVAWFVNQAVAAERAEDVDFVVSADPSLSTLHYTLDADSHSMTRRNLPSEVRKIKTVTLANVVISGPDPIQYLSIDTEGSEYDILKKYFEMPLRRIQAITVEHNYDQIRRQLIFDLLSSRGYVRRFTHYSGHDDWYVMSDLLRDR